jgi:hypothetical protein
MAASRTVSSVVACPRCRPPARLSFRLCANELVPSSEIELVDHTKQDQHK